MRRLLDAAFLVGCGLLCYGAWRVYAPAGWIVGGLLLVAVALLADRGLTE